MTLAIDGRRHYEFVPEELSRQSDLYCRWPISSHWTWGPCSRPIGDNDAVWGASFCWQHSDFALSYVVNMAESEVLPLEAARRLAKALLNRLAEKAEDPRAIYFHETIDELILARLQQNRAPLSPQIYGLLMERIGRILE